MSNSSALPSDPSQLLNDLLKSAKSKGADAADALLVEGTSSSLSCRLGKPEDLERSEGWDLGLRVLIGKQQAVVSSSGLGANALSELVDRAVAMATARSTSSDNALAPRPDDETTACCLPINTRKPKSQPSERSKSSGFPSRHDRLDDVPSTNSASAASAPLLFALFKRSFRSWLGSDGNADELDIYSS